MNDFIPVSKQLPDDGQKVVICFDSPVGPQQVEGEYKIDNGRGWFLYRGFPIGACGWKPCERKEDDSDGEQD